MGFQSMDYLMSYLILHSDQLSTMISIIITFPQIVVSVGPFEDVCVRTAGGYDVIYISESKLL